MLKSAAVTETAAVASRSLARCPTRNRRRSSAAPVNPLHNVSFALVCAVFTNEDIFELLAAWLGAWSYLELSCISRSFERDAWSFILRMIARVPVMQSSWGATRVLEAANPTMPVKG